MRSSLASVASNCFIHPLIVCIIFIFHTEYRIALWNCKIKDIRARDSPNGVTLYCRCCPWKAKRRYFLCSTDMGTWKYSPLQVDRSHPVTWMDRQKDAWQCFHLEAVLPQASIERLEVQDWSDAPVLLGNQEVRAVEPLTPKLLTYGFYGRLVAQISYLV